MRILVTGGAGYIGNELVYRLSAEPGVQEILVYDNLCKGNYNLFTGLRKVPGNNVRFIQADVLDSRSLKSCMQGMDVVIDPKRERLIVNPDSPDQARLLLK